jgi:hypothetical protein
MIPPIEMPILFNIFITIKKAVLSKERFLGSTAVFLEDPVLSCPLFTEGLAFSGNYINCFFCDLYCRIKFA